MGVNVFSVSVRKFKNYAEPYKNMKQMDSKDGEEKILKRTNLQKSWKQEEITTKLEVSRQKKVKIIKCLNEKHDRSTKFCLVEVFIWKKKKNETIIDRLNRG